MPSSKPRRRASGRPSATCASSVPERRLAWRWHPGGPEAGAPAPDEPRTLVVFDIEAVDGGTLVRVTESGFNQVPAARRARAFADNDEGWQIQIHELERYVSQAS